MEGVVYIYGRSGPTWVAVCVRAMKLGLQRPAFNIYARVLDILIPRLAGFYGFLL